MWRRSYGDKVIHGYAYKRQNCLCAGQQGAAFTGGEVVDITVNHVDFVKGNPVK